ncbi:MAG: type II secretion system minor pseudopilin GspI [Halioglobus sp.]|jgi:general secretion pathway protein I|nr:general secretion pathway protein I [marine gamma proteobacterium HTCC2148]MBT3411994.1 type II secretion system minor pseudopilin GspI [Halieaceae bacterium]MDG1389309.1 type II secretion system minor pseudopilin GspI [Halioglobus sp.]MBT5007715.1 type II secretion system minor pseudopilin GspI [Halieaceae bacterium]MBT6126585.1 type II secretion system minor pseudopilin GspI [Halieaceae bacterium]
MTGLHRKHGFTLVEVMVALAVVALALPALMFALQQQVDATGYLRDKSIAHNVAANKLTEVRILAFARGDLLKGKESGVVTMGEREWYWWMESKLTEVPLFYRLQIDVALDEEDVNAPLHSLVAFLPADLETDTEVAPGNE